MKKRVLNNDEIIQIIELYSNGEQIRNIYKRIGICPNLIKNTLLEKGFKVRSRRIYKINELIFSKIDTEAKAYWLGFLFADGRVRSVNGTYGLDLWLSTKDEDHIIKFKNFLESDHPIVHRTSKIKYKLSQSFSDSVGINVCSKKIVNDLFKLGCIQNKTARIDEPKIKEELYRHFIRGYFDGDGCVSEKNKKGKILKFSSSSIKILEWISKIFKSNEIIFCDIRIMNNYYELYTSKIENLCKIYDFLYKDASIYLDRKKHKLEEIIEYYRPKKVIQKNINGTVKKKWDDIMIASRYCKIRKDLILRCCEGKLNYAGGYKWSFT